MEKYCVPFSTGKASEPKAVGRKLAKLMDALDSVNSMVCAGEINDSVFNLKMELLERLRAEGWRITADKKWKVLPPK